MLRIVMASLLVWSCSKSSTSKPADDELTNNVKHDITRVKAVVDQANAAPAPAGPTRIEDLSMWQMRLDENCSHMIYITDVKDPAVASEYRKVCGHDMPLALMTLGVKMAETAIHDKPDADHLGDCYSKPIGYARGELERNHTADAESQALEARLKAVCPK